MENGPALLRWVIFMTTAKEAGKSLLVKKGKLSTRAFEMKVEGSTITEIAARRPKIGLLSGAIARTE